MKRAGGCGRRPFSNLTYTLLAPHDLPRIAKQFEIELWDKQGRLISTRRDVAPIEDSVIHSLGSIAAVVERQ
jgi:hypothetical protein